MDLYGAWCTVTNPDNWQYADEAAAMFWDDLTTGGPLAVTATLDEGYFGGTIADFGGIFAIPGQGLGNIAYDLTTGNLWSTETWSQGTSDFFEYVTGHDFKSENEIIANLDKVNIVLESLNNVKTVTVEEAREAVRQAMVSLGDTPGFYQYVYPQFSPNGYDAMFDSIAESISMIAQQIEDQVVEVVAYNNSSLGEKILGSGVNLFLRKSEAFLKVFEGVDDALCMGIGYGVGGFFSLIGQNATAEQIKNTMGGIAATDAVGSLYNGAYETTDKYAFLKSDSAFGDLYSLEGSVTGFMLISLATGGLGGGASTAAFSVEPGIAGLGTVTISQGTLVNAGIAGYIAFGSSAENRLNQGASFDEALKGAAFDGIVVGGTVLSIGAVADNWQLLKTTNVEDLGVKPASEMPSYDTSATAMTPEEIESAYSKAAEEHSKLILNGGSEEEIALSLKNLDDLNFKLNQIKGATGLAPEAAEQAYKEAVSEYQNLIKNNGTQQELAQASLKMQQAEGVWNQSVYNANPPASVAGTPGAGTPTAGTPTSPTMPTSGDLAAAESKLAQIESELKSATTTAEIEELQVAYDKALNEVQSLKTQLTPQIDTEIANAQTQFEQAKAELLEVGPTNNENLIEPAQLKYDQAKANLESLEAQKVEIQARSAVEEAKAELLEAGPTNNENIIGPAQLKYDQAIAEYENITGKAYTATSGTSSSAATSSAAPELAGEAGASAGPTTGTSMFTGTSLKPTISPVGQIAQNITGASINNAITNDTKEVINNNMNKLPSIGNAAYVPSYNNNTTTPTGETPTGTSIIGGDSTSDGSVGAPYIPGPGTNPPITDNPAYNIYNKIKDSTVTGEFAPWAPKPGGANTSSNGGNGGGGSNGSSGSGSTGGSYIDGTSGPVVEPTIEVPTEIPTEIPTEMPTVPPTIAPTTPTTEFRVEQPTVAPTEAPTEIKITTEPRTLPPYNPTPGSNGENGGGGYYSGYQSGGTPVETPTEVPTEIPTEMLDDVIKKGNKYSIPTSSKITTPTTTTTSKGNSVIPVLAGLSAAAAAGIGAKAYIDRKNNRDNDDDDVTTEDWSTDNDVNVEYLEPKNNKEETLEFDDDNYEIEEPERYDAKSHQELEDLQ